MNKPFSTSPPRPAVLLIGPTGSGKTPLGEAIAARGLASRRCLHFDFGAELRRAVASDGSDPSDLSDEDRTFIRRILAEGALLEPGDFPVAERLLLAVLARHHAGPEVPLILNGLPRHVDQAEALRDLADVRAVVELGCSPETVLERLRRNTGGDREGRIDDDESLVRRKLALYDQRTRPLIAFYRQLDVPVKCVTVDPATTPDMLLVVISSELPRIFGEGHDPC